ncbi:MAG: V-type ATPase subunit, partial [Candidatus Bathyarchaeota archaeon]
MNPLNYIVVRIHGLRTRLVSASMLKDMARTKDLKAFAETLLKTDYSNNIKEVPWNDISGFILEKIFEKKLVERSLFVSKLSCSDTICFTETYCRRFEVQNITHILRNKEKKIPKIEIEKRLSPIEHYSSINFKALLNSNTVDDAIELLKETIYYPSKEVVQLYKSGGSLLPIEAYFEKIYAEELIKSLETIPEDKEEVRSLLMTQFDIKNCFTVIGSIIQKLNPYFLEKLVIPYSKKISLTDITNIIYRDNSLSLASTVFKQYIKVVKALIAGDESKAYLEGLRYINKANESIRRK